MHNLIKIVREKVAEILKRINFSRTLKYNSILQRRMKTTNVKELLRAHGKCITHITDVGRKILVLPTCTTALEHLIEENWQTNKNIPWNEQKYYVVGCGNFRSVRQVYIEAPHTSVDFDPLSPEYVDVTTEESYRKTRRYARIKYEVSLYVKGPERIFNTDEKSLVAGNPWWGGRRSGEKAVYVDNPIVEEQVCWEAVFLLQLHKYGIRAEVPQAIVTAPDGKKEIIVDGIDTPPTLSDWTPSPQQPSLEKTNQDIEKKAGLVIEDGFSHNCVRDLDGYFYVIDVNRWQWPPYSDSFRTKLCDAIRRARTSKE